MTREQHSTVDTAHAQRGGSWGGLRHSLQHEGEAAFPIEGLPFVTLARQVGGGVREVLQQCRQLAHEDPEHAIHVHWAPDLQRVRWRVSSGHTVDDPDALAAELHQLPGLTVWCELEEVLQSVHHTPPGTRPRVWFDLVARDVAGASQQLRQLRMRVPHMSWWAHRPGASGSLDAAPCRCGDGRGPCSDPVLAAHCERGLPVVSRPYRALASELGRSEREVVLTLRRWQHEHQLLNMSMQRSGAARAALRMVAAWRRFEMPPEAATRLAAHPGVISVESQWLPGWPSAVVAGYGPVASLYRALKASALPWPDSELWAVRTHLVRERPLLFPLDIESPANDPQP